MNAVINQGTIKTYDPQTRSGIILDDARNELLFDLESFKGTGMREFRLGQRVRYTLVGEPPRQKVRDLMLLTLQ
ncbi:MAG: hypothetical protein ACYDCC_15305 [Actinomycetota bacterium]